MQKFLLLSAAVFAFGCQSDDKDRPVGGSDAPPVESDSDTDSDSDSDSDIDTVSDFQMVAYNWCAAGSDSCAILSSDGYLLPGIGQLSIISGGVSFPITFEATEVDGYGEFPNADEAWVEAWDVIFYFERGD